MILREVAMYDLIVVGGGPAGLSATVYAARKRLKTLLITKDIGGQVNWTTGVENYLGYQFIEGSELISKFQEQVSQFPIDQKIDSNISSVKKEQTHFEVITAHGEKFLSKTVLIATGKRPRRLNVPRETELTGHGVTYCSVCDGPIFAGQRVAVIGGGNSALEAALDMVKIAEWVILMSSTPLTGDPILIEKLAEAKNLSSFLEYEVKEIHGDKLVEGITIQSLKNKETKRLNVTGIFVEIGLVPNSELVKGLVTLNKAGEIPVDCQSETEIPGLFAAGDVTTVPEKQIVVAAGEGAKAALRAHRYLQRLAE
jgi:NADH-dependent peroxiredoxin subunit F